MRTVQIGTGLSLGAALGMGATAQAADFTVTTLGDSGPGSLRQALTAANAAPGADRVLFKSGLTGTLAVSSGELPITGPVDVVGPGAKSLTVHGNGTSRLINVDLAAPPGAVSISGLTLTGGNAGTGVNSSGGAVNNVDSSLTVSAASVTGNTSIGGAIGGFAAAPLTTVRSSTVSGNTAIAGPGYGGGVGAGGPVTIENSTITANTARYGGGVLALSGALTVTGSTIAGNTAIGSSGGGGILEAGPTPSVIRDSLIADNTASIRPDLSSIMAPAPQIGFSLIENTTGLVITATGANVLGADPKLGALQDNGGSTRTMALPPGSPALDAGSAAGLTADQRGAPRPFDLKGVPLASGGDSSDIGAYERSLCGGVLVNRVGTAGKDKLKGTKKSDGMLGLGGKDTLKGLAGKDGLCGGPGADTLIGGKGKDVLKGGPGKDKQNQ